MQNNAQTEALQHQHLKHHKDSFDLMHLTAEFIDKYSFMVSPYIYTLTK